jgi:hypothetical protein
MWICSPSHVGNVVVVGTVVVVVIVFHTRRLRSLTSISHRSKDDIFTMQVTNLIRTKGCKSHSFYSVGIILCSSLI